MNRAGKEATPDGNRMAGTRPAGRRVVSPFTESSVSTESSASAQRSYGSYTVSLFAISGDCRVATLRDVAQFLYLTFLRMNLWVCRKEYTPTC